MKAISENLFTRGKAKTFYCRRRIPKALLLAYPDGKTGIVRSLQTRDKIEATKRLRLELIRIDAEFAGRQRMLNEQQERATIRHVKSITDAQLQEMANFWLRRVLLNDRRTRAAGMSEDEFDEQGKTLIEQREELGRMLARGQVAPIMPALNSFMHLCGIDVILAPVLQKTYLATPAGGVLQQLHARHKRRATD